MRPFVPVGHALDITVYIECFAMSLLLHDYANA